MSDDLTVTAEIGSDLTVEKAHSEPMSMTEFVQWMGTTFNTLGIYDALQQAAFMLCCDVISQDMAKSPLQLREHLDNGTSKVVKPTRHEAAALLATEPNHRHTWYEFIEMLVLWHSITKNALAGVLRNNTGDVLELIPFQTSRVIPKVSEEGGVFYDVVASTMHERDLLGDTSRTFPERDMIHVRGRMLDGMDGYSTMTAGRTTLATGASIEEYRDNLFSEDGQIRGVFRKKDSGILDDQAFQRLRQQLGIMLQRMKSGTVPVVLENDMEFQAISSKPSEMELTKQFQSQIVATARLLRVPPHKLFETEGSKYENLETQEKAYVGDCLEPIAMQFEQRFGKALLTNKDRLRFFFRFDRNAMTLRDTKVETDRIIRSAERGLIEIDEARAVLGWNPLPNGQGAVRTIPVNMNVVDRDGTVLIGGQAGKEEKKPEDAEETPDEDATPEKAHHLRVVGE